jgi:uncharacterized protein (DUF302 family)
MKRAKIIALGMGLATAALSSAVGAQDLVATYETTASFQDVSADLQDAVVNRGYVVDYLGRVGEMLKRTAEDVGATKALYKDAEFVQFCSAVVSRAAMEADIGNIAFCPYVLFVYEAEGTPGTVTVGFRRLPAGEGRDDVNVLLDTIAREAAGQ